MRNKNEFRNNKNQRELDRAFLLIDKCMDFVQLAIKLKREEHQRKVNFKNGGISSNEIKPIYLDNKEIVFQETLIDNEEPKYEQTFLVKDGKLTPIKNDSNDK